jgi:hypothetical protein
MATRSQEQHAQELGRHTGAAAEKARARAKTRVEHEAKAKADHASHTTHNEAARARRHSSYELEPGTRKSTRLAANRAKPDSSQRQAATVRSQLPKSRAQRSREGGGR